MTPLVKNLLLALGLAIIVWLGYIIFIKDTGPPVSAVNTIVANQAIRDAQEFLVKLQELKTTELSGELFADLRFRSLVDFRQEIIDEPVGRPNPFLPTR